MAAPLALRVISWNVDGLCDEGVLERAAAVAAFVLEERPDVVLLQEVTEDNIGMLMEPLSEAGFTTCATGAAASAGYFCVVLLSSRFSVTDSCLVPFPGSSMGRHLLRLTCKELRPDGFCLTLLTSHLESLKANAAERKRQLAYCLREFDCLRKEAAPGSNHLAIFAGDTNLRDAEVGKLPSGVSDAFISLGSPPSMCFTWDAGRNDNIKLTDSTNKALCRCRFDRAYYASSPGLARLWKAHALRLLGTAPSVPVFSESSSDVRFMHPSDHFGLCLDFQCTPSTAAVNGAGAPLGAASAASVLAGVAAPISATRVPERTAAAAASVPRPLPLAVSPASVVAISDDE